VYCARCIVARIDCCILYLDELHMHIVDVMHCCAFCRARTLLMRSRWIGSVVVVNIVVKRVCCCVFVLRWMRVVTRLLLLRCCCARAHCFARCDCGSGCADFVVGDVCAHHRYVVVTGLRARFA